jgi:hypothetical protein
MSDEEEPAKGQAIAETNYLSLEEQSAIDELLGHILKHGTTAQGVRVLAAKALSSARSAERERCALICEQAAELSWLWWEIQADPADQGAAMKADDLATEIRTFPRC